MKANRVILTTVLALVAAVTISSCSHRSYYGPGYDYGYGYRYHRPLPPPPPRRVIVVTPPPRYAPRHRPPRRDYRQYRQQSHRNDHYGYRNRTRGPR